MASHQSGRGSDIKSITTALTHQRNPITPAFSSGSITLRSKPEIQVKGRRKTWNPRLGSCFPPLRMEFSSEVVGVHCQHCMLMVSPRKDTVLVELTKETREMMEVATVEEYAPRNRIQRKESS